MNLKYLFLLLSTLNLFGADLILDIGHTKKFGGSTSATCEKEYEYNKDLTLYILQNLNENINADLSSSYIDEELSFKDRNQASLNKDLFISIHHDSVQKQFIDYERICPRSDYASGFSIFVSRKNLSFEQSLSYAKKFAKSLVLQGLKPTLHHAQNIKGENRQLVDKELGIYYFDDLLVLKNASSPAFLFEAGVIVNPKDEELVKTTIFKDKVVKAINFIFD